ncbi:hypothetical protein PAPHI01_1746 [Pancytospora philotis]|nr:hypothetical protein PAPHI01_1746 [Pancytospora philotis]
MNIFYALTLILTAFLTLYSAQGGEISNVRVERALGRTGPHETHLLKRLKDALNKAYDERVSRKIDGMLFQCYYPGQPVAEAAVQANGSLPILHGVCDPNLYKNDPPRRRRRHRHGRHARDAEEGHKSRDDEDGAAVPLAPVDDSEIADREHGKALHRVLCNARFSYLEPLPEEGGTRAGSGMTGADTAATEEGINLASVYDRMMDYEQVTSEDAVPEWKVTSIGRYFFESEHFKAFLGSWQRSSGNEEFHISQADVDGIRGTAEGGMTYKSLSMYNKRRVAKLVFVRNGLETFGMIKAAKEALGLELDEHKTADNFLRAVYEYLMTVDGSGGRLEVALSVTAPILSADMFSIAYAQCTSFNTYVKINENKMVELGRVIVDKSFAYITSMVILFQAWEESSNTAIDPEVLEKVTERLRSFYKEFQGRRYAEGCELPEQ